MGETKKIKEIDMVALVVKEFKQPKKLQTLVRSKAEWKLKRYCNYALKTL